MPKPIMFDQFHLMMFTPRRLPEAKCRAIRRTLNAERFHAKLRRAATDVFRRYPSLNKVRVGLSR
jgi:hypothetical protein